jgi:hypothetical protein
MVQTTGYYLQYVIQVGFDCEAIQQLNFEYKTQADGNHLWGSSGVDSVGAKLAAVDLSVASGSNDCGDMVNPCTIGLISLQLAQAVYSGRQDDASLNQARVGASTESLLNSMNMGPDSVSLLSSVYGVWKDLYGGGPGIPCGTGFNTTHFDNHTREWLNNPYPVTNPYGEEICEAGARIFTDPEKEACEALWAGRFPKCPETTLKSANTWGSCHSYLITCPTAATYFGDTNPQFMDWWTIFYWAWWITWAPFVGFFVAIISRGRTIREVIIGGFVCPTLFAIMWFSVFGGLAVKMQRTAEMALQVHPDVAHAMVTCSEHYTGGGVPITPESKRLATAGYYMLTCMPKDDQIYHIMEPYTNLTGFLQIFLWVGLVIYFLTSSDSGSMVDDIISASGLSPKYIPAWQKVFWCSTEGFVAIALIFQGGALQAVRNVSIIIGLPYTFLLCMMVPSCYRALKHEAGDEDILSSYRFNTQLLDICEFFKPNGGSPFTPSQHLTKIGVALVCPFLSVRKVYSHLHAEAPATAVLMGVAAQLLWLAWVVFHFLEISVQHMSILAWLAYLFMAFLITSLRVEMRGKFKVWGSPMDDLAVSLLVFPFTLAQMEMMAETNGEGAPLYFASTDEMIEQMKAAKSGELPVVKAEVKAADVQAEVS